MTNCVIPQMLAGRGNSRLNPMLEIAVELEMAAIGTHTHLGPVTLDTKNNVHQQLEFRMNYI